MSKTQIILLTARATVVTAMHVGCASVIESGAVVKPTIRGGVEDVPYLPGSSIKGRARALLCDAMARAGESRSATPNVVDAIFGSAAGRRGSASFWDAPIDEQWLAEARAAELPITQLRSEARFQGERLRGVETREVVVPGVPFTLRVTFDFDDPSLLDPLLASLKLLELYGVGAGTSRGMGRLRITEMSVRSSTVSPAVDIQSQFDEMGWSLPNRPRDDLA